MRDRDRDAPGFTLIELLVVITIVSLLIALLRPARAGGEVVGSDQF